VCNGYLPYTRGYSKRGTKYDSGKPGSKTAGMYKMRHVSKRWAAIKRQQFNTEKTLVQKTDSPRPKAKTNDDSI